jgi:hypothetical protein
MAGDALTVERVAVGGWQFMVDDPRRMAIGLPVGICLPAAAQHLYPAAAAAPPT